VQRDEFTAARAAPRTSPAELGSLSRKYESNGNPGLVSSGRGDHGGRSYGAYQFSSKTGSAAAFTSWLSRNHPDLARDLAGKTPATPAFDTAWKATARRDPSGFLRAQHDYIQHSFYDPAASKVKASTGLDVSQRSHALRDVLWSTAVQHGQGGANSIFKTALGGRDPNTMSDKDIINAVYAERGRTNSAGQLVHFRSSSPEFQRGIANRFRNERQDALAMLAREGQGAPAPTAPGQGTPAPTAPGKDPAPTAPTAPTTPAPAPAPQAPLFRDSHLARGDRSQDVRSLQEMLRKNGINPGPVDGIFGPRTERAVREFQARNGLQTDGIVGEKTSAALRASNGTGAPPAGPTSPTRPSTPTGPTAPTTPPAPGSGSAVPNGVAQIQSTQNAGARNQMVTGQITVNGNTYQFRSGGHGRGSLPTGQYTVTPHLNSRSDRSMSVGGVGWSFAVSDKYDPRVGGTRSLLRIHPDGGTPGTEGCIGIVGDANTMRRFRDDMNAELQRNGGRFTLTVR
jgi:peptidoglycan hydrolase-like protein with peptidoglycan-binding domain